MSFIPNIKPTNTTEINTELNENIDSIECYIKNTLKNASKKNKNQSFMNTITTITATY